MPCDDCPKLSCEITELSIRECCYAQFVEKMKKRKRVERKMSEIVETRKEWEKDDLKLSVKWVRDHYCGYVWFPKRPVKEQGHDGILTYVPVHGGITYAKIENKGMTYGFDCAHCDDWVSYNPTGHKWTLEEVITETEKMARAIQLISKYEKRYLRNITNKGKAKVIDEYHKELGVPFNTSDNFGAMLNLLSGKL